MLFSVEPVFLVGTFSTVSKVVVFVVNTSEYM